MLTPEKFTCHDCGATFVRVRAKKTAKGNKRVPRFCHACHFRRSTKRFASPDKRQPLSGRDA